MKYLAVLLICLSLCFSCTSTNIDKKNADGSPIWTTIVPESNSLIYGVGSAKFSTPQNSTNAADAAARADLSRKIESTIKEATSTYSNDAEGQLLSAYEQITLQVVDITLRGIKVEQRWTAEDGTVWSLVSFKAKDVKKNFEIEANKYENKLIEKKMEIEAKRDNLLAELAKREEDTSALQTEVIRQANKAISDLTATSDKLDVNDLVNALASELVALGYTSEE